MAKKPTYNEIGIQELEIISIAPDPNQPRKEFEVPALQELADSIKKHGVLQPIMVQPDADGYQLVFGERRMRAAQMAGLTTIPAIISQPLTEDQALEIQVLENLHRKNINPIGESDAFKRLINKKIATAKQLADKLGVSVKYVYDRLALQSCILEVREAIRAGKLTLGAGKKFAQLSLDDQRELFEDLDEDLDIDHAIRQRFTLKLDNAPFDKEDVSLNPGAGACSKCQKRSGCNKLLFDDIVEESICFDKSCYEAKANDHIDLLVKSMEKEGKKVVRLTKEWESNDENVLGRDEWHSLEIDEDDNRQAHSYGIIVQAYNKDQIGRVVKLAEKKELHEDDDDDQDDSPSGISTLVSKSSKPSRYLLIGKLEHMMFQAVHDVAKPVSMEYVVRAYIKGEIGTLNENDARAIVNILGLEVSEESDEYDIATILSESDSKIVLAAAKVIMHRDKCRITDQDDISAMRAIIGAKADELVAQWEKENDCKL